MKLFAVIAFGVIATIILLILLGTIITSFAWNAVMPHLFNLPEIDLLQALALNFLAAALIKPFNVTVASK